jgi:hypothetical protein
MPCLVTALSELISAEYYADGYMMILAQYGLAESPLEL